jgi:hypothetical protein
MRWYLLRREAGERPPNPCQVALAALQAVGVLQVAALYLPRLHQKDRVLLFELACRSYPGRVYCSARATVACEERGLVAGMLAVPCFVLAVGVALSIVALQLLYLALVDRDFLLRRQGLL